MSAFFIDYMIYIQESKLKSEELEYHEMNQFFWKKIENNHWREKRGAFYQNYDSVLYKLENDVDGAWVRHVKNYIARDNLLHYLSKINKKWIRASVDTLGFEPVAATLTRSKPVIFLTFHNFYQVLSPLVLAQYFGPVFAFALDEVAESDRLIRTYMTEMYESMESSFNGGALLKVGGNNAESSRIKLKEILEQKGNVFAAIDMVHPLLGSKTKVSLGTDFFEIDVLTGLISTGLENDAQFVFPFISLVRDGSLRLEMFSLAGTTMEEVLESYQNIFNSILLRDISVWEGASLLTYKEGKFS